MAEQSITLTQLKKIPESVDWEAPRGEAFFQLGCTGCESQVCFRANGVGAITYTESPLKTEDDKYLMESASLVEKGAVVGRDTSWRWLDACENPCEYREEIETAVDLLNEKFDANLITGA